MDHQLAELVSHVPAAMKMRGRETKHILKKMVLKKGLIPREIVRRRKQGFGAPVASWMKGGWKDLVAQTLDPVISSNYTGLFDREYVRSLLVEPYLNSNRLLALMTFVMWHRMYVDGDAMGLPPPGTELAA